MEQIEKIELTIDNKPVEVEKGITILEAARRNGIDIPTLCFLKDINEVGDCRMCIVEVEGRKGFATSCIQTVEEGMVVKTHSPEILEARKIILDLILSNHHKDCLTCSRSGNCELQQLCIKFNVQKVEYEGEMSQHEIDDKSPAIMRDFNKCILCRRCVATCKQVQEIGAIDCIGRGFNSCISTTYDHSLNDVDCTFCGQCIESCPTGALKEKEYIEEVWEKIKDEDTYVVVQTAPAVRVALGEEFGLPIGTNVKGKMVTALKQMGFDKVFDTNTGADFTIMEEANELLVRLGKGDLKDRPMFTSCCPGWVRFIKSQFPHLVKYLSSAKSPQQMFGAVMKTYFAEKLGVSPEKIYTVSVMPCVAKKAEREMDLYYEEYAGHDIDAVITTRELIRMIRSAHISPQTLVDVESDRPMHEGTGAGVIFGATGGVMEAALRYAYYIIKGENPPAEAFTAVRSQGFNENDGVQEANFQINDITVRTAVVSGLGNTRELIRKIESGEVHYDFVEVMACPGGCVGGGGQPIHDGEERAFERGKNLYYLDRNANLRFSHENPDVIQMYKEYFEAPMSHKAHMLLHTEHKKNMQSMCIIVGGFCTRHHKENDG